MKLSFTVFMRHLFLLLLLIASVSESSAESIPWSLGHYHHTPFTKNDGVPPLITSLQETSDGYLWAVYARGLVRFDGKHFLPFISAAGEGLISNQISNIFAPSSGGIWVSYKSAGVSFIKNCHVWNYKSGPLADISSAYFLQDRRGVVLAATSHAMFEFTNGQWTRRNEEDSHFNIARFAQDSDYNLWAISRSGHILILRDGEKSFRDLGIPLNRAFDVVPLKDHSILVLSRDKVLQRYLDGGDHLIKAGDALPYFAAGVIEDRRGNVWVGTVGDGVHYLGRLSDFPKNGGPPLVDEKINHSSGLTGNVQKLFEDKRGNVWIGTDRGIDRFTPSSFEQISLPEGISTISIAPGKEGDAWIGSENFNVLHFNHGTTNLTPIGSMAIKNFTSSLDGTVLMANSDELWKVAPGQPTKLAVLPAQGGARVRAISRDKLGQPLLSFRDAKFKLASFADGKWASFSDLAKDGPLSLHTENTGVVWAGFANNRLASLNQGSVKWYSTPDGISVGQVKIIALNDGHLWLGGEDGLQFMASERFKKIKLDGQNELKNVSGVVFDNGKNLWVHTLDGLFRIESKDVQHAMMDDSFSVPYRLFDWDDGLPGFAAQIFSLPTLSMGGDGNLWISGQYAAARLDPREIVSLPHINAPTIDEVIDGVTNYLCNGTSLQLPSQARNLKISFAIPELNYSSRVQFQYRLIGFDSNWQSTSDVNSVQFTDLTAGDYKFEVRARYAGQQFSEKNVTAISFSIAPKYFETWWFRTAAILLVLMAIWQLGKLQTRLAVARERHRIQIRMDERGAIARDLHDTLLQSVQALVLNLDALSRGVTDLAIRDRLNYLADKTQMAIIEGRDKVQVLRSSDCISEGDVERLIQLGTDLGRQYGIRFDAQVNGKVRPLNSRTRDELIPIVSELLINAFRHSKAGQIALTIKFDRRTLEVNVVDDGVGIDDEILLKGAPSGHWGLLGLKERSARIGASIKFNHVEPHGTCVVVSVSWKQPVFRSAHCRWTHALANALRRG